MDGTGLVILLCDLRPLRRLARPARAPSVPGLEPRMIRK